MVKRRSFKYLEWMKKVMSFKIVEAMHVGLSLPFVSKERASHSRIRSSRSWKCSEIFNMSSCFLVLSKLNPEEFNCFQTRLYPNQDCIVSWILIVHFINFQASIDFPLCIENNVKNRYGHYTRVSSSGCRLNRMMKLGYRENETSGVNTNYIPYSPYSSCTMLIDFFINPVTNKMLRIFIINYFGCRMIDFLM